MRIRYRSQFFKLFAGIGFLGAILSAIALANDKPNIVIVFTDD